MAFVVPKVVDQFDSMGRELPALTKVVIALSELMTRWGLPALVLLAIGAGAFARLLRRPAFRLRFDALVLRAPPVRRLVRDVHAAKPASERSIRISSDARRAGKERLRTCR